VTTPPRNPRRLDPPAHYDAARREVWADAVARLADAGGVFRADPNLIDAYVEAVAAHRQATELRAKTNVMITQGNRAVENPALGIQRRTAADMARAARSLGLHKSPMVAPLAESPMVELRKWCEEHGRWECSKHRSNGQPCHQTAVIPGTDACYKHVGMSREAAREKGAARLARMYGSPAEVTPGEALLEEVRYSAGHVRELRARVSAIAEQDGPDGLPGSGLFFGTTAERDMGDGIVVTERRAGPHVILRAYNDERDHLVRAALAAHTAGAQEGAVEAARLLGAGLSRLLDVIFAGLELSAHQREVLVPQVVPAAIRAWNPEEPEAASGPS
jgi:P27 family predicted phage terminase small subunit